MKKILIADDEQNICYTFTTFLREAGYSVESESTLSGCIKNFRDNSYDLLFLDMNLGHENSIDFIKDLKVIQPDCAIIVITGSVVSSAITKSRKYGAIDYLVKPIRKASLLYVTQRALEIHKP